MPACTLMAGAERRLRLEQGRKRIVRRKHQREQWAVFIPNHHDGYSKYPPAKPGALRCEPPKAAYPGGFGAVSHLLRGMRHQVPKLTILKHAHLDAPLFAAA